MCLDGVDDHMMACFLLTGVVTTLAGSASATWADGNGGSASFCNPVGVVVDSSGTVFVADNNNNRIRKVSSSGACAGIPLKLLPA